MVWVARRNLSAPLALQLAFFCAVFSLAASPAEPALSQKILDVQTMDTAGDGSESFEPLERWKEAVLAGNKTALARFYSSAPSAIAHTPQGTQRNPSIEEPEFWASMSARGLLSIFPKVLEHTSPQGATRLVLRIEMTFRSHNGDERRVVSADQIWVKQEGEWRILITRRGDLEFAATYVLPEPEISNPHLYSDPSNALKDLQAALISAKANDKRILMIFGANWCYDCHVIDAALRSKEIAKLLALNYEVVHINVGDGESNSELADRCGISLDRGIPSLAVLDSNGRLISSQTEADFRPTTEIRSDDIATFLIRWKPATVPPNY